MTHTPQNGHSHNPLTVEEATLWWEQICIHSDSFFEAIYTLQSSDTPDQIADLLITLEMTYHAVETTPYPLHLKNTRKILLEAMSNVLVGLAAALNGNLVTSTRRIARAQSNLQQLLVVMHQAGAGR